MEAFNSMSCLCLESTCVSASTSVLRVLVSLYKHTHQVLPLMLQNLPLKEDMEELPTVYGCLLYLFGTNNPVVRNTLSLSLSLPPSFPSSFLLSLSVCALSAMKELQQLMPVLCVRACW